VGITAPAMSRVYCPRHPERTVFYRVLFHYFESFLLEYEKKKLIKYLKATTEKDIPPGIIAVDGDTFALLSHFWEFLVTGRIFCFYY